jgi:tetratricopeptide (TPR) repeat protein
MARTLRLLGETARLEGNHELAVAHTEERLALSRAVSDDVAVAHALQVLGELALAQGALVKATALLDESVALRRLLGDSRQFADGLHHRAWVALRAGDLAGAAMRFEENLEYAAARAQTLRVAQCLVGMAEVAQLGGDKQWAATLLGAVEAMSTDLERLYPHGYDLLSVLSPVLAARATLRDEEHATAWDAGRTLHWRDAVQLAKRRTGI